jgi:methionine sulfoxide reductase heme-binding subunit
MSANAWIRLSGLRAAAHAAGVLPLAWMLLDFALHFGDYAANRNLMLRAGSVGLILLVASFACSPLARVLRQPQLTRIRRALGLYGFLFVCIHLLAYLWLDNDFVLELVLRDLDERRAMAIGMAAFAALLPLALTSTAACQRRLGRRWRLLHKLIFVALPLSVWHYLWLDRDFVTVPLAFGAVVLMLIALRLFKRTQPAARATPQAPMR